MAEEVIEPIPNLSLSSKRWTLKQPKLSELHEQARQELLQGIEADGKPDMTPFLASLLDEGLLPRDNRTTQLLSKMQEANKAKLDSFQAKLEDAKENLGETEVAEAVKARATYLAQIGHKTEAMEAYKETIEKTAGLAPKIDLSLSMIRVAFFHADHHEARRLINSTKQLIEQGGDWDRRNRLKVYHGTHLVSAERDFKAGAALLLDALATFTASEVMSYNEFTGLCIIAGTLACDRKDLKKRIIDTPEVKTAIAELPHLDDFADSLHQSRYATFFQKLAEVEQHHLYPNHLLAPHARFYVSELRIKAYSQYLESYRSVSLRSLSDAFGLSPEWLDADLARFIAAGRLNYKIDKVNGVIETARPDAKSAKYEQVLRSSDALLNNIQRLSRVVG